MDRAETEGLRERRLRSPTLVYAVHTATPAGTQHTAEHLRLINGRITPIRLILDATPAATDAGSLLTTTRTRPS